MANKWESWNSNTSPSDSITSALGNCCNCIMLHSTPHKHNGVKQQAFTDIIVHGSGG